MVRRGEYLERAVVVPGEPALAGLYHRGSGRMSVLLAPPHPARGGGMESPVVAELAWRLTRAGHPTLRFDYPGVGASAGDAFDADQGLVDAALRARVHLEACAPGLVAGVGVGLGGAVLAAVLAPEAPLVWVMPDLEARWPDPSSRGAEVTLVLPEGAAPELVRRAQAWADSAPRGALRRVPGADPSFLRGLVTLGTVVEEVLNPPGLVELDESGDDFLE